MLDNNTTFAVPEAYQHAFGSAPLHTPLNPPGFFQAFIAVARDHPIIDIALHRHVEWYAAKARGDADELYRVTRDQPKPNVGTVLLRDAFLLWAGRRALRKARERGLLRHANGHVSQFFKELPDNHPSLRGWLLPIGHRRSELCSYVVADVRSRQVLFLSRVIAPHGVCSWGGRLRVILLKPGQTPSAASGVVDLTDNRTSPGWSDPATDTRRTHEDLVVAYETEQVLLRVAPVVVLLVTIACCAICWDRITEYVRRCVGATSRWLAAVENSLEELDASSSEDGDACLSSAQAAVRVLGFDSDRAMRGAKSSRGGRRA